jgi:hypothetical protein
MLCHMRGHQAPQQHRAECLVAAADITIAEPPNEITAADAQRSGAVQDEAAYRIFVFSDVRLNRCRTHWPSIRSLSRRWPRGSIRRFSRW